MTEITNEKLIEIASEKNVFEINIINTQGIISHSTNNEYINFDMSQQDQSSQFLVLLNGQTEIVQDYQAISFDENIYCKYAGVVLETGGFVQVGYDVEHFQEDIASVIKGVTANRHIGTNGCIFIIDEKLNVVSSRRDYTGEIFSSMPTEVVENERFTMNVYGEDSYCMYTENEGYYIVAVIPISDAVFSRNISIYVMLFMELLIFVCLFVLIYFLIKKLVVNNIRKVNESLAEITDGNLNVIVDVRTNEEFSSLSDDINSTVITLKKYIAEAAARIDKELEFAKSIQHSALPSIFPPFPNRTEFEIFARMDAAKEVGGDFYDFYFVGNDELVFLIADVSGKGIPAAMFMMRAKALIKGYAEAGMSVEKVLTTVNNKLCDGNDAGMFVTAWIGKINLKTGIVSFSNAGHNPPLVKHKDNNYQYLKAKAGFVLGGIDDIQYTKNELQLLPNESIFLYTDGVTEATNINNELYGEERLQNTLDNIQEDIVSEFCQIVKKEVDNFVGEAPQFDDITMVYFRYKGEDKK